MIGDVMLDQYVNGEVTRVNPEAPVLVLEQQSVKELAGGAANVSCRLVDLGVKSSVVGLVGDDAEGKCLDRILSDTGVGTLTLVVDPARPTTVKTRYMCGGQQLLRVDRETVLPPEDPEVRSQIVRSIRQMSFRALVVSDYAKGVLCPEVLAAVREVAGRGRVPVVVDPRGSDWDTYGPVTVIKPNARELAHASGMPVTNPQEAAHASRSVLPRCEAETIVATLGHFGIVVTWRDGRSVWSPAHEVEVFDVTGAGDAVAATLVANIAANQGGLTHAIHAANAAASQVVQHRGVGRIDRSELQAALRCVPKSQVLE